MRSVFQVFENVLFGTTSGDRGRDFAGYRVAFPLKDFAIGGLLNPTAEFAFVARIGHAEQAATAMFQPAHGFVVFGLFASKASGLAAEPVVALDDAFLAGEHLGELANFLGWLFRRNVDVAIA